MHYKKNTFFVDVLENMRHVHKYTLSFVIITDKYDHHYVGLSKKGKTIITKRTPPQATHQLFLQPIIM